MRNITNQYHPQTVTHPGETLREKLEEMNMGSKEFAVRTGKPEKTISGVLNRKSAITSDMAVIFERVLKIPATFWLKRQYLYDESQARNKQKQAIVAAVEWAKSFPYPNMAKKNWVNSTKKAEEKVENLLSFFSFSSHEAWEGYFIKGKLNTVFRISLAHTKSPHALSAWLRKGEIDASKIDAPIYSKKKLENSLPALKKIMMKHPNDFFHQMKRVCQDAGVKLIYTPCLPKAPINGATRWLNNNPIIQLSCRYKQNDHLWFTFFHEVGHVLLHGKKEIFLEDVNYSEKDKVKEDEANAFAIKWTFSEEEEEQFMEFREIDTDLIIEKAEEFGTHPALILGRLHRKHIVARNMYRELYEMITLK